MNRQERSREPRSLWQGSKQGRGRGRGEEGRWTHEAAQRPDCAGWEQERWASRLGYEWPGQAGSPGGLRSEEGAVRMMISDRVPWGAGAQERSQGAVATGVGIAGSGEGWAGGWQGRGRERDRQSPEGAEA